MNYGRINNLSKRYCSYNGCSSDSVTTNNGAISFFGFPKDTERCSKWITNSGREEFRYLTPRELSAKKICELHFASCMFTNAFRTNLKKSAFPMNWKNASPELIEIDDDDDNDHNIEDDIESIEVNGTDVHELSDDENETEPNTSISRPSVLNSVSINNPSNRDLNNEVNGNSAEETHPVALVIKENCSETRVERQPTPTVSSSTTSVDEIPKTVTAAEIPKTVTTAAETTKTSTEKSPSKPNPAIENKTKFHNLPSQTTQGEFYYQQCPSVEETNHSYPEPPDVEMPLFVQQNSVVSIPDEGANSETTEPPSKRRKRDKNDDLSEQMQHAMKYLKDITALLTTSEDEFELFGKSVALQLKLMSLCTALTVQAKIQQLLSQYRINDIKKKAQSEPEDSSVLVNGSREDKSDEEVEDEHVDKQNSPQLSLDCTSETSDNEVDQEGK